MSLGEFCELLFFIAVIIYTIASYRSNLKLQKYIKALETNNTTLRALLVKTSKLAEGIKDSYLNDITTLLDEKDKRGTREDGNQSGNSKSSTRGKTSDSNRKE